MKVNPNYLGRLFTEKELTEEERQVAVRLPAMRKEKGKLFCQRCNSLILEEWYLPIGAYYCRECLLMKRVRSDQALYYFPQEDFPKARCSQMAWSVNTFSRKSVRGTASGGRQARANLGSRCNRSRKDRDDLSSCG